MDFRFAGKCAGLSKIPRARERLKAVESPERCNPDAEPFRRWIGPGGGIKRELNPNQTGATRSLRSGGKEAKASTPGTAHEASDGPTGQASA